MLDVNRLNGVFIQCLRHHRGHGDIEIFFKVASQLARLGRSTLERQERDLIMQWSSIMYNIPTNVMKERDKICSMIIL